jgi:hypothetical protein
VEVQPRLLTTIISCGEIDVSRAAFDVALELGMFAVIRMNEP